MRKTSILFAAGLLLCAGCVATQKVPVSTDPQGATVYLDGQQVCSSTPCSVEVPKDQDHLLTITKDGYRQKDVPIRRVFDTVGTLRESVREGMRTGSVTGAVKGADESEREGRAYQLSPDMVTVRLRLLSEPEPEMRRGGERGDASEDLGAELFRLLEGGLKGGQGGGQ